MPVPVDIGLMEFGDVREWCDFCHSTIRGPRVWLLCGGWCSCLPCAPNLREEVPNLLDPPPEKLLAALNWMHTLVNSHSRSRCESEFHAYIGTLTGVHEQLRADLGLGPGLAATRRALLAALTRRTSALYTLALIRSKLE